MTYLGSWSPWAVVIFLGGPYLLGVLSFLLSLHIGYRYLDLMLDALKNSRYIASRAGLIQGGWFGRLLLVAKICGVLIWSKSMIRAGELDSFDIQNFPCHLKRWINAKILLTAVIICWLALSALLVALERR
jgi:hypothetical protein